MQTQEMNCTGKDRRWHLRFPVSAALRYQIRERFRGVPVSGCGEAQDICSRGLAFHSDVPLMAGMRLNVSMEWPAQLGPCLLRLEFQGTVLRTLGNLTIVRIERPEFRTAGRITAPLQEEIANAAHGTEKLEVPRNGSASHTAG